VTGAGAAAGLRIRVMWKAVNTRVSHVFLIICWRIPEVVLCLNLSRPVRDSGPRAAVPRYAPPGGDPLYPLRGIPPRQGTLALEDPPRPGTGPRREGLM